MPIVDEVSWGRWVEANKDEYGKACVNVAREVMKMLDENVTPLENGCHPNPNTAHSYICRADSAAKAGGLTGFMATGVASMVKSCHSRGDEFAKSFEGTL